MSISPIPGRTTAPIPAATLLGYVAEGARTNLCLQSQTFDSWTDSGATVTANSTVAPDGTTTADTITRVAGQGDARYVTPTLASNAVHAVSLWIKKGTSPSSLLALYDATAIVYRLWVDITWSGTTPSLAFTNGSLVRSTEWTNGLWRIEVLTEAVVAANTNRLYLYPGRAGSANGETVIAWGAQVELGSFASSYIATTTAAVTRNADVLTYSSAGNILGTAGWCYAEITTAAGQGTNQNIVSRSPTVGTNGVPLYIETTNTVSMYDGTGVATKAAATRPYTTPQKVASTWGGSTMATAQNGVVGTPAAFDGDMSLSASVCLGSDGGIANLFGTMRNVRLGQRLLSTSEEGAITA